MGIDFGHAFGSATQILPIPELMPFRLTRQLTGFLQPLDSDGLLKHNMIHTLRGALLLWKLHSADVALQHCVRIATCSSTP